MKRKSLALIISLVIGSATFAQDPCAVTHWEFQAVFEDGTSSFDDAGPDIVSLEGIVLNNPGDMVDPTPDYQGEPADDMGGEWQIFIQGEGDDHAATAIWMGQNYSSLGDMRPPEENYTDANWIAELKSLNSAKFSQGDRVRVIGRYLFYKGKLNINERHYISEENNFTIELLERGVGLPRPEIITLDQVKDANDNYIFDHTRLTGCEYYQGRLVRINNVGLVDANEWGPQDQTEVQTATIIDSNNLTFPLKLGLGTGIYAGSNNLSETFDVIGIFDQEPLAPPYPPDPKAGYRIWVMDYDGNGSVLASREHRQASKPGDTNMNGMVNLTDFAKLAEDWLK